jgi:hypothetical protein
MLRTLVPYLILAALIVVAAGVAYGLGAPAWVAYAALIVALAAVLPGFDRWDQRHHP